MKVLLIYPPAYRNIRYMRQGRCQAGAEPGIRMEFPIFLAYVASILREHGHSVGVIDAVAEELSFASVEQRMKRFAPDAVIVETVPMTYRGDMRIAEIVKQIDQEIYTIYYGWQATARPADVLASHNIDFVIRGEPEYTSLELVNTLEHNGDLGDVQGLSFKNQGIIKHNPSRPLIEQIDELPHPARDLFPLEKYVAIPFGQITTVVASMGCPYGCIYCASHLMDGSMLRLRQPKLLADEIENVVHKFNIRTIFFYADNFTLWGDKNIVQFCKELSERKLDIRWLINSRVDTLPSENTLKYMARFGCFLIQFGVESGSLRMIETMKKARNKKECGRYVKAIKPAIEKTKKAGILTKANMIVGFQGETRETVSESVNLIKECAPDLKVSFFRPSPFPGTVLGEIAERRGLFPPDGKGLSFERTMASQLYAIVNDSNPHRLIELQEFANYAVRLSVIKKLELGLKLSSYFVRRRDVDVFKNILKLAAKEKGRILSFADFY